MNICSQCFGEFSNIPIKSHLIKYQVFCSYECFKQYKEQKNKTIKETNAENYTINVASSC